ncbi:phosphoporin PhoE [Agarivorans sp. Toyoura001]|uniref:porin n=1 Tax=Agarivorans sp. Toyoura001 TaxID=2283141 RepID=UPI0010E0EB7A|nr:porin [Agarivorans sp. Toyoura001]GDY27514.1 phosphoporin PhoE [Agarivorans sp. Toyoura001]
MKKTILAIAIPALFTAGATNAQEIYNDGENSFSIGGRLNLMVESADNGVEGEGREARSENNSSRINLNFSRKMSENVTARATMEYGIDNPNGDSDAPFFNRLGFVAFDHADYGSISYGKQWSTYYTVTGVTDVFWVYGGSAMGIYDGDHGETGAGRANDALQYNGSFGGVNLSGQYQFADENEGRKDSYSGAVSYDFDFGLNVGATYHQMNRTDAKKAEVSNDGDIKLTALAASYNQGPIYAAVSYGEFKNHVEFDGATGVSDKAMGHEGVFAYTLDMGLQLYTGWNYQEDKNSEADLKTALVGAMYDWNNVLLYTEYQDETVKSTSGNKTDDNRLALGVRYNF